MSGLRGQANRQRSLSHPEVTGRPKVRSTASGPSSDLYKGDRFRTVEGIKLSSPRTLTKHHIRRKAPLRILLIKTFDQ